MTGTRALIVTFAIAAIMVAAAVGFRETHSRLVARHIRDQMSVATSEQAEDLLQQALKLGDPGIHVLVDALGSPRAVASQAAMRVLTSELTRWELLRARRSTPKLALLASALAERVDGFEPSARKDAAELVTRILLWPLGDNAADRACVIAACEKVLIAATARNPQPPPADSRLAHDLQSSPPDLQSDLPNPLRDTTAPNRLSLNSKLDLFRDDRLDERAESLPAPPRQQATVLRSQGSPSTHHAIDSAEGPAMLPPVLAQRAFPRLGRLESASTVKTTGQDKNDLRSGSYGLSSTPTPKQTAPQGEPRVPPVSRTRAPHRSGLSNVELIRRLRAEDPSASDAARAELVRRGFTEVNLEMARQLFDPDPRVRMQLVRVLPELQSVDAEPWLRQLSQDQDPGIRREALAALARRGQKTANHATSTRESRPY